MSKIVNKPNSFLNKNLYTIIFFALGFLIYGNSLLNDYALDDAIVITQNEFTKKGFDGIPDLMTNEGFTGFFGKKKELVTGGRYRPLSLVTFAVEYQLFKQNPFISHLINIILYILTTILLFKILVYFFKDSFEKHKYLNIPFIVSILFLAHPIHTEVVANIKGRDEIMTVLGSLGALYYTLRYLDTKNIKYLIFSSIVLFLGLMSKENAITFLAIIPISVFYFTKYSLKHNFIALIPLIVVSSIYLFIRNQVIGFTVGASAGELMNNPYLHASTGEKFATVFYTMAIYIKLLIFPHPLTYDYYPKQIPIIGWSDFRAIFSFAIYLVMGIIALIGIKKKTVISYGIWFYLISFSVVSNLIFNVGTFMNERFMYLSSIGALIILAYFIVKYLNNKPKIAFGVLAIVLILFSSKTISRNFAWENDYVLFTTDVKTSSESAKSNTSAGGKSLELVSFLKKIKKEKITNIKVLKNNLDKTTMTSAEVDELMTGKTIQAINTNINTKIKKLQQMSLAYLEKAVKIHPTYNDAILLLGNIRYDINNKDIDGVWDAYNRILTRNPKYFRVYQNLGIILNDSVPTDKRIEIFNKLFNYNSNNFDVNYQLGHIWGRYKGNTDTAIFFLKRAVQLNPKSEKAYKDLGVAYGINKDYKNALTAMNKSFKLAPKDDQLLQNIGITYMQLKDFKQAAQIFKKVLEINPKSQSAINNLVVAYMNSKQFDKAINILHPMYQQNTKDFNLNYNLGVAYQGKSDLKMAQLYLSNAKQINPQMYRQLTGQ